MTTACINNVFMMGKDKKGLRIINNPQTLISVLVPGAGIEPAQPQGPRDFKSLASTNSATQARNDFIEETLGLILFLRDTVKNLIK